MPNVVHAVRRSRAALTVVIKERAVQASLPSDGFAFLDRKNDRPASVVEVPWSTEMAWRGTVSPTSGARRSLSRRAVGPDATRLTRGWRIADDLAGRAYDAEYVALAHLFRALLRSMRGSGGRHRARRSRTHRTHQRSRAGIAPARGIAGPS
jgi:hypothetical protein